ncbi:XrtA/PEP-CTERM system TPR-repeat protein PrsT [Falsiroseomonas tokyonensis]|uniref:XrtA/PEP-CTERM system TPR-repeat protein PrsT n=1 Tax=Falsiroseomonas tokyonensis TaxID=430521 RepID=A0ABV7BQ78_9PROT|nr:XrtA/PEP-CTERM system TPR-repeat protein PrsT [Falsiroseomonas tokyonensis]MBU8536726.1 PEP-CTERM system TPR-repeat protein PrsT [Falsiroseomonas tokyonensis]
MARYHSLPALTLAALMAASVPAFADAQDRARAAAARGELRAAQIEWRNAVREQPDSGAVRMGLAEASLQLGDAETAQREARAALERGHDPAAATALLLRSYLIQGRMRDLLADFPEVQAPPDVAAQVAAARALAQLSLRDVAAARSSVALAERLDPGALEPGLAAVALAVAEGDRAAAEARVDRLLQAYPDSDEAWLRKGSLQMDRGDRAGAVASFGRVIARAPGDVPARLRRADARLRMNEPAAAAEDIDAVLAIAPNNVTAAYLRAMQLVSQRSWQAADAALQRISAQLSNFPDGFLLLALTKTGLGQRAQAEDAARRHVARWPDDPRGAKLLAGMVMADGRNREAVAVLTRATQNRPRDAQLYDLLARAQTAIGARRQAVQALEEAARIAPEDAALLTRLAIARMAAGDAEGAQGAVERSLDLGPAQPGAREMLAAAALARGDLEAAAAELEQLDAAARQGEMAGVLEGTLRLLRLDLAGARAAFEGVLARKADSAPARLGLARVLVLQDSAAEAVPLLGAVLRAAPGNVEAMTRLAALAQRQGPVAEAAQAALAAAQAAHPAAAPLALARANMLLQRRDIAGALALLDTPALRNQRGVALPLARSELHAAAGAFAAAETAAQEALAEDPASVPARRQRAALLLRAGDARGAEALLREGLRASPGDAVLQQALLGMVRQTSGAEAAQAEAARMARQANAGPDARALPGDVLMGLQRHAAAAEAYAAAQAAAPSSTLALRQAAALRAADRMAEASRVLEAWVAEHPDDLAAQSALAQLDLMAGRHAAAEARLRRVVAAQPENALALNNLAWVLGEQGEARLAEARGFAERAYYLSANAESADTLGWILARSGEPRLAVTLLRQAVAAGGQLAAGYHLAHALHQAGDAEGARRVLAPVLASATAFPERAAAERLHAMLAN